MVDFLIRKPVSVIMTFVAFILLGVVAIRQIPISLLPDIVIPQISVKVNKKDVSAKDINELYLTPIKNQLLQTTNLVDLQSNASDNEGRLELKFDYKTNMDYALVEVNERLDQTMSLFPKDFERPRALKSSSSDIPVFSINVYPKYNGFAAEDKMVEVSSLVGTKIKSRLEQLKEIALVDITGLTTDEVVIQPKPDVLRALGIKEDDFKKLIEDNNISFSSVAVNDGVFQYDIKLSSLELKSTADLQGLLMKYQNRIFKLKDIASISSRARNPDGEVLVNGHPAINMAVVKQPNARVEDLRTDISALIKSFKKEYPELNFEITQDQTQLLTYSINNLEQDLLVGSCMAFILMVFFLRSLRSSLLISIAVPVSLIISLLLFNYIHLTINIISLSGLVLGVGLMIDNTIIVIDNITQFSAQGIALKEACALGTQQVIRPLITSALTTCSVFLPLIFLSGIGGALFYDQAIAITIGLCVSLIIAITLLPVLYFIIHRFPQQVFEKRLFRNVRHSFFDQVYEKGFHWVFQNKLASVFIIIVLVLTNIFFITHLKKEKFPGLEEKESDVRIKWNESITINENATRVAALVEYFHSKLEQDNAFIGKQQFLYFENENASDTESELYLKTKSNSELKIVKAGIALYLSRKYPKATYQLTPPKDIFEKVLGNHEPDLILRIVNNEGKDLPSFKAVDAIEEKLHQQFPGIIISAPPVKVSHKWMINEERLMLYELTINDVYNQIKSNIGHNEIAEIKRGQQNVPILLEENTLNYDSILEMKIKNANGTEFPLSYFLTDSYQKEYETIQADKSGSYISLKVDAKNPLAIIDYSNRIIGSKDLRVSYSGAYFTNRQLIVEMSFILLIAIALLYFILAAQFESMIQPLIVLLELPISVTGALIVLYFFNSSLNLISMIGLIVMCGIVINDSILKIDTINRLYREEDVELLNAIHQAGQMRLKSILMTAFTTILSVAPFMFGADVGSLLQRPLSLALIGGMLVGTPVSLYFIPLVYWYYYKGRITNKTSIL